MALVSTRAKPPRNLFTMGTGLRRCEEAGQATEAIFMRARQTAKVAKLAAVEE
jgi:hypothetical protein